MSLPLLVSYALLWVLVIFQGLLLIGLVRTVYRVQRGEISPGRVDDLTGYEMPAFSAIDLTGQRIESWQLADRLTALLFVSPSCEACTTTLAEIEALNIKARGNVLIVCQATHNECLHLRRAHGLRFPVIADEERIITELFRVNGAPTAVLISKNRIESYGHPMRGEEFREMFGERQREEAMA